MGSSRSPTSRRDAARTASRRPRAGDSGGVSPLEIGHHSNDAIPHHRGNHYRWNGRQTRAPDKSIHPRSDGHQEANRKNEKEQYEYGGRWIARVVELRGQPQCNQADRETTPGVPGGGFRRQVGTVPAHLPAYLPRAPREEPRRVPPLFAEPARLPYGFDILDWKSQPLEHTPKTLRVLRVSLMRFGLLDQVVAERGHGLALEWVCDHGFGTVEL